MNETRKIPQFIMRYANNKKDRVWESGKDILERYRKIDFAVLDYQHNVIEIDECMMIIAQA